METRDAPPMATGQNGPAPASCARGKLLLCDDEESIRGLFQMILAEDLPGVDIDLACNGQEALDIFAEKHHAVLLMDLHMPVMDGRAAFEAVTRLCRTRDWQMPSFVFCTGFAPPETVMTAVEDANSPHCLLCKPVSGQTLVDTVRTRMS